MYRESCLKTFNNLELSKSMYLYYSNRLQNFNINIWYTCLYAVTKWNLSTKHIFYCVSFSSLLEDCKFPPERIKEVSETYQVIMVKKVFNSKVWAIYLIPTALYCILVLQMIVFGPVLLCNTPFQFNSIHSKNVINCYH